MLSFLTTIAHAAEPTPTPTAVPLKITNPLASPDLIVLIEQISDTLIKLAIPIAVILIIWIGIQFFLAQGNPEKITKAKSALLYLIIGLAILLIGRGFVSLIESILNLGK